jgi:dihydrofolate reductase
LLGRTTYETFAATWPTEEWIEREGEFAERMNSLPKYVASTTLEESLEWDNAQLLQGDIAQAVGKLKQESGQDLLMYSSVELMRKLMESNLVDRFRIWVHPLILGSGKRLFEGIDRTDLKLADTTTLSKGVVVLDYQLAAGLRVCHM